ncbi:hypothetical protein OPQ81_002369 [Rhizoctonia solani]|nr:hypothetical protein OPQ81_002369 [Rhizoctonia solani]
MNFLDAYTSYPAQNSANPFALFGAAQSPLETCEAYRTAGAYRHSKLKVANRNNRAPTLSSASSSLDCKSENDTPSCESRSSKQSWLGRRRDALKQLF